MEIGDKVISNILGTKEGITFKVLEIIDNRSTGGDCLVELDIPLPLKYIDQEDCTIFLSKNTYIERIKAPLYYFKKMEENV